ncbi:MAG: peptidoglycan-associated lipoprotein Pal [Gammaproteobacteria bacterium]|nr:peptidoglycan-associated lipoprotein Pal [Gammaproteobacteria bacterium]
MKLRIATLALLAATVLFSGCETASPTKPEDAAAADANQAAATDTAGVETSGLNDCLPPCTFPKSAIDDPNSPLAKRVVYFEFDKADIAPEYQELLIKHSQYLVSNPSVKVRLEGHTDERGSREYNLALGEQRAKSVQQFLLLQGAPKDNIGVTSFGEELPIDVNHSDEAWGKNRRVELVYDAR